MMHLPNETVIKYNQLLVGIFSSYTYHVGFENCIYHCDCLPNECWYILHHIGTIHLHNSHCPDYFLV